jgi:hypothetical protein
MSSEGIRELKNNWLWLCLLMVAFLPFVLRLGLDVNAVNRQALRKVYRAWMLSPEAQQLKKEYKEVRFEKSRESGVFDDLFLAMLQRDFRVVENPEAPWVRSFFEKEKTLRGRIEWSPAPFTSPQAFQYESRFTNNAILLGFWIALILMFFTLSRVRAAQLSLALMLLWQVRWDPLSIPKHIYAEFKLLGMEQVQGIMSREFILFAGLGIGLLLIFLLSGFSKWVVKKTEKKSLALLMGLSFLFEPFLIYFASVFAEWGPLVEWWKVYVGSLCFRFVAFSFLFLLNKKALASDNYFSPLATLGFSRQKYIETMSRPLPQVEWNLSIWCLLMPLGFVLAGGWEWLNAVLIVDAGWSILMLKAFLTGLLLALVTGSRWLSMLIGILALAQVAAPSEGHWVAAAVFGFFMEGLWIGWFLSPFKGWRPYFPLEGQNKSFLVSALLGWSLGIFTYTAGVPLVLCWILVLLGVWTFGQIQSSHSLEPNESI